MSKSPLRKDKTCLNCNSLVAKRFCPNCGQENIDIRKTFYQLFIHFFNDLTHYENSFWKTIKNLILKPASLTKEYLSGKRVSYLAPIRLYIFINFITFFIISILQNVPKSDLLVIDNQVQNSAVEQNKNAMDLEYNSLEELKLQKDKMSTFLYWFYEKIIPINQKYTPSEIKEKFAESAKHNFPKVLFFYMPLFALILWLFHGKRRWYYFDHGIFTLHYFSFLLLILLLLFLFNKAMNLLVDNAFTGFLTFSVNLFSYCWMVYYFFPAHHRFYEETKLMSFIKSILIFLINMFLLVTILFSFAVYTFISIH